MSNIEATQTFFKHIKDFPIARWGTNMCDQTTGATLPQLKLRFGASPTIVFDLDKVQLDSANNTRWAFAKQLSIYWLICVIVVRL